MALACMATMAKGFAKAVGKSLVTVYGGKVLCMAMPLNRSGRNGYYLESIAVTMVERCSDVIKLSA